MMWKILLKGPDGRWFPAVQRFYTKHDATEYAIRTAAEKGGNKWRAEYVKRFAEYRIQKDNP